MTPETELSRWLADIAANLLCVVLVVLVLLSVARPSPDAQTDRTTMIARVEAAPLSGARAVELLFHRVAPPPGRLVLELAPDRIVLRGADGARTVTVPDLADARGATLFVFAPEYYGAVVARLTALGVAFEELSVPEALRAKPGTADRSLWAPQFEAALEGVKSPAGFRAALRAFLVSDPPDDPDGAGDGSGSAAENGASHPRFAALRRFGNLAMAVLTLFLTYVVFRRGIRGTRQAGG